MGFGPIQFLMETVEMEDQQGTSYTKCLVERGPLGFGPIQFLMETVEMEDQSGTSYSKSTDDYLDA